MNEHIYTNPSDIVQLLANLPTPDESLELVALIDARQLRCPMPLLKTKIALRQMQGGEQLYLVADDPNAGTDLGYFCEKQGHQMTHWQSGRYFCALITKSNENM